MDVVLGHCVGSRYEEIFKGVSILVLMDVVLGLKEQQRIEAIEAVSILVLMDVVLGLLFHKFYTTENEGSQSLF